MVRCGSTTMLDLELELRIDIKKGNENSRNNYV
jgi:hypothetical protein